MTKLVRGSALHFGINLTETVVGALATLYFSRLLGAGAMGSYFLAFAILNWGLIPNGGLNSALLKRISEKQRSDEFFTVGVIAQTGYLALGAAFVLLFSMEINEYISFDGTHLIATTLVALGVARFMMTAIRGENRVDLASILEGGRNIGRVGFQLGFVLMTGLGVMGLLMGELVAAVVILLIAVLLTDLQISVPGRREFVELYEFVRYSWLGSVKGNAYSWTDTLILGFLVTTPLVGVYEIAWRISMVFLLLPGSMGNTVYPTISEHTTNGDTDAIRRILCRVLAFAPALAIPGTVGALVIGPQVLGLYGPEFVSGGLFLLILSVARVAESYEMILTQTLYALDYPDRAFRVAAVFITANLVLNIALGILFGAVGAAVATTISMVVSLFLGWRMLPSSVTPSFPFRTLVTQVASALVMGAILVVVTDVWPIRGDLSVVLYALFGAGLYAIGILVGSPLARDVLQQFRRELTV